MTQVSALNKYTLKYLPLIHDYKLNSDWIQNPQFGIGIDPYNINKDLIVITESDIRLKTQEELDTEQSIIHARNKEVFIDNAHDMAQDYIRKWFDEMGLIKLTNWKNTAGISQGCIDRIIAVESWVDAVMTQYFTYKYYITINLTPTIDYSICGECPYKFTEIMSEL